MLSTRRQENMWWIMLTTMVLAALLIQGCNNGVEQVIISGGNGGPTDSKSLAFELGGIEKPRWAGDRDTIYSVGILIIFNGGAANYNESASGTYNSLYDWERRNGTLQEEGTYRDWPEFGFFLKYGIEIIPDTNLFLTGFGGCTFADEVTVYDSEIQVYPRSYGKDEGWTTHGLFGGGLAYFVTEQVIFQFDYDNRRGISAGMGWRF